MQTIFVDTLSTLFCVKNLPARALNTNSNLYCIEEASRAFACSPGNINSGHGRKRGPIAPRISYDQNGTKSIRSTMYAVLVLEKYKYVHVVLSERYSYIVHGTVNVKNVKCRKQPQIFVRLQWRTTNMNVSAERIVELSSGRLCCRNNLQNVAVMSEKKIKTMMPMQSKLTDF